MTPLNWLTVATSLLAMAMGIQVIRRPAALPWRPPVVRLTGIVTILFAAITLLLTFTNTHGV